MGTRAAGLAVCVALVVASCAANSEPTATTSTFSQPATTAISSAPTNSALNSIDPAAFQAVVDRAAKELLVPGAVVVLRTPQGNFEALVGTTELGVQTPPNADTHFRIASNTKTMTAALIVLLAQDGKLEFSDPVSKYVPNVPNGNNITIAELLKMRSGLYGYTDAPELSATLDADPTKAWTPQDVLAIAFRHPPQFAPDASYEYSNTNYALLGLIAEKVGGRPLRDQLQDRLFGPLGLTQTSLPATDDTSIPAPYSHGYMYGGTFYALADEEYPADMQAAARAGTLQPVDYTNQNPSYATARRRSHLHGRQPRHLDPRTGVGEGLRRRLSAAVAHQPASRGPGSTRRPEVRVRDLLPAFRPERRDVLPRRGTAGLQLVHGIRPG